MFLRWQDGRRDNVRLNRIFQNAFLLFLMVNRGTRRGAGRGFARNSRERKSPKKLVTEVDAEVTPRPTIFRLLLHPNHIRPGRVIRERLFQKLTPQWIELLQSNNRDIFALQIIPPLVQLVINFARAEQHTFYARGW